VIVGLSRSEQMAQYRRGRTEIRQHILQCAANKLHCAHSLISCKVCYSRTLCTRGHAHVQEDLVRPVPIIGYSYEGGNMRKGLKKAAIQVVRVIVGVCSGGEE
jgi:hypothetical protein